ncbi:MAG: hypothetical protein IID37_17275, partial [Planctomycetes bacterium]|nr:hypothetical protein [Planctomycetota bacterium]
SVRSADYQLKVQIADGSLVDTEPGTVRTLRGRVVEVPGSVVAGSLLESGLQAKIVLNDDLVYWVEPLAPHLPGVAAGAHVIYNGVDVRPDHGTCGLAAAAEAKIGPLTLGARGGSPCGGTYCVAELGIDADVDYYQDHGSSVSQTEAQIEAVINTVNLQYESDVAVRHEITAIIVRTSEPDPYSSFDPFTLLTQFRNEWLANQGGIQRDVAHLFTGKNLNGGVIGIAYDIGAICTSNAYCLSESDFNGSFSCATDLTAHELGHLWNGFHCGCPSHTMNSFITCANVFHPTLTVPGIVSHRDSRTCLDGEIVNDGTPPTPNPMTFDDPPHGVGVDTVFMKATIAEDGSTPIDYQFDFVVGGVGGTDSNWQSSTIHADFDLAANTGYTYRVRARDGGENATEYSENATGITYIETPVSPPVILTVTNNSVEMVTLDTFTNLFLGLSGLYFDSTSPVGGDDGINEWIQSPTDTATNLFPNTLYTFVVRARNQDGVETDFGPEGTAVTLANVPGAPLLSDADCDTLDLDVDPNGNLTNTTFAVQCTDTAPTDGTWDGMYLDADGNPSAAAVYRTDAAWGTTAVLDLEAGTNYAFVATAINQEGVITEPSPEASLSTPNCGVCEGDVNDDGTVDPLDSGFVLARFGCSVGTGDPSCDVADANGDGAVDPLDVGFVLARFGDCS